MHSSIVIPMSKFSLFFTVSLVLVVIGAVNGQSFDQIEPRGYAWANNCGSKELEQVNRCEKDAQYDWDIRESDYLTSTRKFCCFVWSKLKCELDIIERCDSQYAAHLSYATENAYQSICEYHSRRSVSCALRWWSLTLIILGVLVIIAIIVFIMYRRRQSRFTHEYETAARKTYY